MTRKWKIDDLEGKHGEHDGYKYMVMPIHGSYCGYVSLPNKHSFISVFNNDDGLGYNMPIDVHGGITYREVSTKRGYSWIGFDCHHAGDLAKDERGDGHRWSEPEVEQECKKLIKQCKKYADIKFVNRKCIMCGNKFVVKNTLLTETCGKSCNNRYHRLYNKIRDRWY